MSSLRPAALAGIILMAAAGVLPVESSALAQDKQPTVDPKSVNGRNFGGFRLQQTPVTGPISMAARRAWTWNDAGTQRLFLAGDVRVVLGIYRFTAARAVAWVEPLPGNTYQVFVYFDRVGAAADAAGSISISADRLPVRGVLTSQEGLVLKADVLDEGSPRRDTENWTIVQEGEAAFAKALRRLIPGYVEPPSEEPIVYATPRRGPGSPTDPATSRPYTTTRAAEPGASAEPILARSRITPSLDPIFAKTGLISFSAGNVTLVSGEKENAVMATDGVAVSYSDKASGRTLEITAQRAVMFLPPGKVMDLGHLTKEDVRGIYVEGDVIATDGKYTLRGPRIYYDVQRNKAVVLDGVFWTYDEQRRLPLYVRADAIKQESAEQFRAESATFSNSAFFDPEFAIGATSVTISRRPVEQTEEQKAAGEPARDATEVDARNITLRGWGVPFFYWPVYKGDPSQFPLKDLRIENSSVGGVAIKTRWNAYNLLGLEKPQGLYADFILDYYGERGPGVGGKFGWDRPGSVGNIATYIVPFDRGSDIFPTGVEVKRHNEFRGVLTAEERWVYDENWTIFGEASYMSDEGVNDAFFRELNQERREFTNRLYARRLENNTAFTAEAKTTFNDFTSNEYLLQSQGYSVSKLPEVAYYRQADDLLSSVRPGLLTYWSEYRAGRLSMNFDEIIAAQRGFIGTNSQRAFGINDTQSIAERLRASGYFENPVYRVDTRHEVSAQLHEGPVNITPFVVARGTFYDNDFTQLSPNETDNTRAWGAVGARVSTTVQHVYDGVDSRLFDLHRLRHILEPHATVMTAGANVDRLALPVYDESVESLITGSMVRVGVDQTFQTQRGGPGRWHTADVLKINTDFVFTSSDADPKSPIGRFFDYRPELSNPGNYFVADAIWNASDTFAITAATVFDFDLNAQAATDGGFLIRHSPQFQSFVDAHHLAAQDSTVIRFGTSYELTSKYLVGLEASYNTQAKGFQGAEIGVRRRFENMAMGISLAYDDIRGETSLGFIFEPYGATGSGRIGGVGGAGVSSGVGR